MTPRVSLLLTGSGPDKVGTRPSDRLDDSPKALGISLMDGGHPRLVSGGEELAGGCEFGPGRVVEPGHLQEVAPQRLGLVGGPSQDALESVVAANRVVD